MTKKSRLVGVILAVMLGSVLQARTFPETRAAAEKGDADAQFELALYHSVGICVKGDAAEMEKWFRKAAGQGHIAARAYCLSEGYGVGKDPEKAAEIARPAAEAGDTGAQFCMGIHYAGKNDPEKSVFWFRKAAEQGNSWAQVFAGMAYLGIIKGIPEDPEEGARWLRKAAEQGNPMGQMMLGGCYAGGQGVPRDLNKAAYWLRQAAAQGCEPAKAALKKMGY